MSVKNLIVGQSGGPTAVINSSLYGVVSEARRHPESIGCVYGMVNGIEGFLNDTILDFADILPGTGWTRFYTRRALISVPAVTSFRSLWTTRFIRNCLRSLKK